MFVNLVQFGYFILFGLLKVTIGQALVGETGSDVKILIEFVKYPWSCDEINIFYEPLQCISSRDIFFRDMRELLMKSTNNGVRCLPTIMPSKYETRIFNFSISFPTYVTFALRNLSIYDSGWYHAMKGFFDDYSSRHFGKRILLVGDIILRTCTLKQLEFELVLPLSVFNETVAVVFCSVIRSFTDIISICNPDAGTCVPPPIATFPRFQCRMNGSRITITLTSVQLKDEGIYALIESSRRIIYQSAVLSVTECVSTTPASDIQITTTELPKLSTIHTTSIISSEATITDKSFVNYFVGGAVVAGITIVMLTCWFLWKRCYRIGGNGTRGDDYDTVDVHYYCSIRNQNQCATQSEAITGSVPESQPLNAVMEEA